MEKWSKSVAIVTGANSGNGFAILKKLAEAGITVIGFDLNTNAIDELKSENINYKIFSRVCDVTSDEATESSFQWVEEIFGGVDILINNAGSSNSIQILEHTKPMSELAFTVDLNFTSVVRCARLAFKSMEARDSYGYIVNINSVYGHSLPPLEKDMKVGVYPGTKYAVTAITEIIRQELVLMKNQKVRVTSLSPGIVDTNIFKASGYSGQLCKALLRAPHLSPDDIGDTVIYLLSTPYHVSVHELTVRATSASL